MFFGKFIILCGCLLAASGYSSAAVSSKPQAGNAVPQYIVLVYADDVGFGDLSCYQLWTEKLLKDKPSSGQGNRVIKTPGFDSLAASGIMFTDAHSSAATCTPSRYSLMSGNYPFRKKGTDVLSGEANLILDTAHTSLPAVFKQAGYVTGVFGKWHLGLGKGKIDWNKNIAPGPKELGFDHSWVVAATGDRVPCVMIADGKVDKLDANDPLQVSYQKPFEGEITGKTHPSLRMMLPSHGHNDSIINGIPRIGFMRGGKSAIWNDETLPDEIWKRSRDFIRNNKHNKFFLMLATHDIHVPRVPAARWRGKSGFGLRGDMILQLDETIDNLVACLKEEGIYEKTMIIFSSDNGPMVDDGYQEDSIDKAKDFNPSRPWKGGKYSVFEGGTRVPFIVSWPERIRTAQSSALVCQMDLLASFAAALQVAIKPGEAVDSINLWPALLDAAHAGRKQLVATHSSQHALRLQNWKYIPEGLKIRSSWLDAMRPELQASGERGLLFDLTNDPGEQHDCSEQFPEKVLEMREALSRELGSGQRSFK